MYIVQYLMDCFFFAGVCNSYEGTEPGSRAAAGERRRNLRAQGGEEQYQGKNTSNPQFYKLLLVGDVIKGLKNLFGEN